MSSFALHFPMKERMISVSHNSKVYDSIVGFNAIDMVDNFGIKEWPSKISLHLSSMFKNIIFTLRLNQNVSVNVHAPSTFPSWVIAAEGFVCNISAFTRTVFSFTEIRKRVIFTHNTDFSKYKPFAFVTLLKLLEKCAVRLIPSISINANPISRDFREFHSQNITHKGDKKDASV